MKIFKRCGFAVIEEDLVFLESEIPTELIQAFKNKDETWKATSAHLVLKKN